MKIPSGGESNTQVAINSSDLQVSSDHFDSDSTCQMYKGRYLVNGEFRDAACKIFLFNINLKHKKRFEKELTCMIKLNHPNILYHYSMDFSCSILVAEFVRKV